MPLRDDLLERAKARVGVVLNGKWRLDEVLGIGGMATVYAATHRNQKRVAIKLLHPEVSIDQQVTIRFTREGYVANTVGHPGAVSVLDDDVTADGSAFLVMELLEGETLDHRWERTGPLPAAEVLDIADQLLDVLAAAHAKGILHRDLKPENLLMTRSGQLKVLDFGIARVRELTAGQTAGSTRSGSLLGTPAFMAPEQARGRWEDVDERSDLWAAGATMYTLLTGRFVHETETVNEQLIQTATQPAAPISKACPALPPEVARVVDRALAYERAARWPDALAFQRAVREAAPFATGVAIPGPKPPSREHLDPTVVVPYAAISSHTLRSGTVTTGRPFMSDVRSSARGKKATFWLAIAAPAVILCGVALYAVRGSGGGGVASSGGDATSVPAPSAVVPVVEAPPHDNPGPDFQNRLIETAPAETATATHVGLKAPEHPIKPPKVGAKPPPSQHPAPEPAHSASPPPGPKTAGDLFEKRH